VFLYVSDEASIENSYWLKIVVLSEFGALLCWQAKNVVFVYLSELILIPQAISKMTEKRGDAA